MRTTNTMLTNTFLRNLYTNNKTLNNYANQLSSNGRITRPSDDPIGTVRSIQVRKSVSTKEDYQKTVKDSKEILTQAETCLYEVTTILKRMEELVGIGESDVYTAEQKQAAAEEVLQLRNELVDIGNSTYNDQYIFSGYNTSSAPFKVDDNGILTFNGIDLVAADDDAVADELQNTLKYQVDASNMFEVGISGVEFMGYGENNIYDIFTQIAEKMSDPNCSAADLEGYSDKINSLRDNNLATISEIGGKQSRLDLIDNRFEDDLLNLEERRSNIEDIDQAEVITQYKFAYTAFQQSLAVGAQIIQPSLLDYIG